MTILLTELKAYHGEVINDTTANGGRRGTREIVTGAVQNVFPHVFKAERTAGLTRRRKVFYCNVNDADETAAGAQPFFHAPPSSGDHFLYWHAGTNDDTQNDITDLERRYGTAALSTAASAGSSTLIVTVTDAAQTSMYTNGDPLIVSDKATPTSVTGNEEAHVISGAPVVAGLQVTITIAGILANDYAIGATVSSGMTAEDIECSITGWAETCAGTGTFDESTYPVTGDNIGTVYDTFTLTFSDATTFSVVGAAEGAIGSGTTAGDFAPVNSARSSKPFFTLESAGWAGTWASGDTVVFTTVPAELPIWETLVVPALADPLGNGGFYSFLDCETA